MHNGIFCISLDFELFWGVRDHRTIDNYGSHLRNVHVVVPRLLELFKKYNVHCTWATVGILFCNNKEELLKYLPAKRPGYKNPQYDPYAYIETGRLEEVYHFAPHLISLIQQYPGQELGSHTFSHYYCLEEGQTAEEFESDLQSAITIAKEKNIQLESLVFPRNQFNDDYLLVCKKMGITAYRGNERSWLYTAKNRDDESLLRRAARFIDAYINISGHHSYPVKYLSSTIPVNIPSSRFLRPYNTKLKILDGLRLQRILNSMTHAAKQNELYHLWWHPHNFGGEIEENFSFLKKILEHYSSLQKQYNMQSFTMNEIVKAFNLSKQ